MAQRVQIVQRSDGTWVRQIVEETSVTNIETDVSVQSGPEPAPLPPPQGGFFQTMKGVLDGDTRWNPVTRRYEWVELNRPERTGVRKVLWGR